MMESIKELEKLADQQQAERTARAKKNIAKHNITVEKLERLARKAEQAEKEKAQAENQALLSKIQQLEEQMKKQKLEITELKEKLATIRKVAA